MQCGKYVSKKRRITEYTKENNGNMQTLFFYGWTLKIYIFTEPFTLTW
jgi:hypothetical protein